jgi:hypothetical protein
MSGENVAESRLTMTDAGLPMMNLSGVDDSALFASNSVREIASRMSTWVSRGRAASGRSVALDPGAYVPEENPYDEMRAARHAFEHDHIVSGVGEVTEAMAFAGVKWESSEPDDADAFNQLADDQDLDAVLRRMWSETYQCSQAVVAGHWGWCEYVVRGRTTAGNRRKRTYRFWAPQTLRLLDTAKVVPVGTGPLANSLLAWHATPGEIDAWWDAYDGRLNDPLMLSYFSGQYTPGMAESAQLAAYGVMPSQLLLMNPDLVWRHTLTMPDYRRHPAVRLRSAFHILDLKQQLINSDRAMLVGSANYILLIRKGSEQRPAQQAELDSLQERYQFIAKLPVIVADHRLTIDIIAPKTDFVLDRNRYDTLDDRLLARLLGTLVLPGGNSNRDTTDVIATTVARGLESRRHMLRRAIERHVARAIVNHPRNAGVFAEAPSLVYTPRNIALSLDAGYLQTLLALRTQRELSRDTILEHLGLDEATEAMRMQIEQEIYDPIFRTQIPYSATGGTPPPDAGPPDTPPPGELPPAGGAPGGGGGPGGGSDGGGGADAPPPGRPDRGPNGTPVAPAVTGGRGGRPAGGGRTPANPVRQAAPRTRNGNPKV